MNVLVGSPAFWPPITGSFQKEEGLSAGDGLWHEARVAIVKALADLFGIETLEGLELPPNPAFVMVCGVGQRGGLAGLPGGNISFPQWICRQFSSLYAAPGGKKIAKKVACDLKIDSPFFESRSFKEMFGFSKPNGCQNAVLEIVSQLTHPMLVAVESSMGSGKTEAALASYAHIAEKGETRGLYYALPTQATGNAMLPRMEKFLNNLKADNGVELHLLHSNADLNSDYEELRIATFDGLAKDVSASSWFTARKRGLLAGFGIGTIDQALMGALKVRHFFVRLFGLSGKVLVLDEVHAYDAYMQQEIISLLGWIGQCGTSIILLSATLTRSLREKLFKAYRPDAMLPEGILYPCVTGMDMKSPGVIWNSINEKQGIPICIQTVVTSKKEHDARIIEILKDKLSGGGSAACLMNTVKDAQRLYRKIKKIFPEDTRILFHSRFRKARRLAIEKEILDTWGKNGKKKRPHRGVVVATQVIEQSVDVDFDFMISDLAPADLLLQRAGRLHRHKQPTGRPVKLADRLLVVMVPNYCKKIPEFGDTGFVYKRDVLMRTALWLSWSGDEALIEVNLPGNGISWIEYVYEDDCAVPAHLVKAHGTVGCRSLW